MPTVHVESARQMCHKYATSQLLELRDAATDFTDLSIDIFEDIDKSISPTAKQQTRSPVVDKNTVIKFRKTASPKEIKFVEDLDIPITQIIHAYNLSDSVTWPILKTFCEKTAGVPSLDVRMMRRRKPAEARIIFRTEEEAQRFLTQVPSGSSIKGRVPKFELECTAPKHSPKIDDVLVCTVVDPVGSKGSATTVECSEPMAAVQVAQVSHVEDDCSAKAKGAEESVEEAVVPTAVALVQKDGSIKSQFKGAKAGAQGSFNKRSGASRAKTGTLVGISLDTLRRNSGVLDSSDMFSFDTNVHA